jgi:hypothetical protein
MYCRFATGVLWQSELLESGRAMGHPSQPQSFVDPDEPRGALVCPSPQVLDSSYPAQQSTSTSDPTPAEQSSQDSDSDSGSDQNIGSVLKNGRYECSNTLCANKSFKRPAELKRHYNTIHAAQKPEFWCKASFCNRNAAAGGKPFYRKYRLQAHMRTIHPGISVDGDVGMTQG